MCVLVVEDEPITRLGAVFSLQDAGHEVMDAYHGPHALDIIEKHPDYFTLLVTDYAMPYGLTGAHVVEHMRESYPGIPMVLATGIADAVAADWLARHTVQLLIKPYALEELVSLVAELLRRKTEALFGSETGD